MVTFNNKKLSREDSTEILKELTETSKAISEEERIAMLTFLKKVQQDANFISKKK